MRKAIIVNVGNGEVHRRLIVSKLQEGYGSLAIDYAYSLEMHSECAAKERNERTYDVSFMELSPIAAKCLRDALIEILK